MIDSGSNPATGKIDAALVRTIKTLEGALNQAVKGVLNAPLTAAENYAAHLRAHRKGLPSRILSDPELEAFIRARIDTRTFVEIVKEVDATFPPDRRTSVSAISRWWRATQDSQTRLARGGNHEVS